MAAQWFTANPSSTAAFSTEARASTHIVQIKETAAIAAAMSVEPDAAVDNPSYVDHGYTRFDLALAAMMHESVSISLTESVRFAAEGVARGDVIKRLHLVSKASTNISAGSHRSQLTAGGSPLWVTQHPSKDSDKCPQLKVGTSACHPTLPGWGHG